MVRVRSQLIHYHKERTRIRPERERYVRVDSDFIGLGGESVYLCDTRKDAPRSERVKRK